jgi:tetratricopeptide (TPR) repeat protein
MRALVFQLFLIAPLLLAQNKPAPKKSEDVNVLLSKRTDAMKLGSEAQFQRNDLAAAEQEYSKAVAYSRQLPDRFYPELGESLARLSMTYELEHKNELAKQSLDQRVQLLQNHPDTNQHLLGIALFDLESFYAAQPNLEQALATANRATAYYEKCKTEPRETSLCDRRLADVQGLMGATYFLAKDYDRAEPWLRSVVARKDDQVRPSVMLISITALAKLPMDRGDMDEAKQLAVRAHYFKEKYPEAERELGLH